MESRLAGQTVVVIGGSSGIGLETARQAHAAGAQVVLTARSQDRLESAARELEASYTSAFDAGDLTKLEQFFVDLPGPVDHVMLSAGGLVYVHRKNPARRFVAFRRGNRRKASRRRFDAHNHAYCGPSRDGGAARRSLRRCGRTHRISHRVLCFELPRKTGERFGIRRMNMH